MNKPRARKYQPNDRLQRAAAKMLGIAPEVTEMVANMRDELATLGYAGSSRYDGSRGGGSGDPVGRDAARIMELTSAREDVRDSITDVCERVDALVRLVKHLNGTPLPGADGEALCCDKQMGREGAIEWGNPACTELPVTRGLCPACYHAERRWRMAHGLPGREEKAA